MPDTARPRGAPAPPRIAPAPVAARVPAPPPAAASRSRDDDVPGSQQIAERALEVAYRTALGVTRDPELAADVAQEVAITALRRAGSLRDPRALNAWIHRIAVRAAIAEARRGVTRRAAEDGFAGRTASAHHDGEPGTDAALVLLAGLPPRQRAALTLRYVHDLDDRQIARALGCRVGTVRSLLSRGRATLRYALDQTTTPSEDDR